jgi:glycosyltransferase involved in cell wall biosynthesis
MSRAPDKLKAQSSELIAHSSKLIASRRVLAVVRHPVGGIRTYLLYTYPLLAEKGYSFTFVIPAVAEAQSFRREVEAWPETEVVEAPMDRSRLPQCVFTPTVRRLLRQRRFQLIHSHGIRAAAQAVVANFGIGVPHIATSHDVVRREEFRGLAGRLKLMVLGALLSRVDALVTVSGDARQNHLEMLPLLRRARNRIVPIVNGINTDLFTSDQAGGREQGAGSRESAGGLLLAPCSPLPALRRRLDLDDNVFLAGFLGRFMEQKGFLVLVDALDRLLQEELPRPIHVMAMESGDFVREYQAIVRSRPRLAGRISFLPREPNAAPVLRQLDALVMPSLWEPCGILAMEAMAVGVPVIGSNCPGLREVLRDTPSRSVPPNDPAALAEALRAAMLAPRTQEALAYAATARQRFDARHTADGLLRLFDKATCTA